jgi:glycosyltransferase involved in cell wall biosynthesis
MYVGIDAASWANPRGYGRYTRNLLGALLAAPSPHTFHLIVDNHTAEKWSLPDHIEKTIVTTRQAPTEAASANGRRSMGDMWAMTNTVRGLKFDAFFFPSLYTYFPLLNRSTILVGIHDVIAEKYPDLIFPDARQRRLWRFKSWLARRQADFIITVSNYAKDEIAGHFKLPADKLWVVSEAPEPLFRPAAYAVPLTQTLSRFGLDSTSRYIVCLGGLNPHKNLTTLLEVFANVVKEPAFNNLELVLIGPAEEDAFTPGAGNIRQLITGLKLENSVHLTGFLPDQEVAHLLTGATLLVMPSVEEGFGLGAVEAAACGTAVIATRNSPLPELLEDAGLFIDPHKPAELEAALLDLLTDDAKRLRMAETAQQRANQLTWPKAAGQFLALLDRLE